MKDGQTIGQWLNWDFEVDGDLKIRDKNRRIIYYENSGGNWAKWEYDSQGNEIYYENSHGDWVKRKYDSDGNEIYHERSDGYIKDNRTPQIIEHNGRKYQLIP